jgi:hypothetical protein
MTEPTSNTPLDFSTVDLNAFPPSYSYSRQYWHLGVPGKQIRWLLDQNRLDDAVVYFLFGCGSSFVEEIPFLHSRQDSQEIVGRLRQERRIKLYGDGLPRRFRTDELVLGPNSGIAGISREVAFLLEPQHPWYCFKNAI